MLCPNCETENKDDAPFCVDCGFPLSGSIARGAGAASPARTKPRYDQPLNTFSDPLTTPRTTGETNPPVRTSPRYSPNSFKPKLEDELARQAPAFSWEKTPEPEIAYDEEEVQEPEEPTVQSSREPYGSGSYDNLDRFQSFDAYLEPIDEDGNYQSEPPSFVDETSSFLDESFDTPDNNTVIIPKGPRIQEPQTRAGNVTPEPALGETQAINRGGFEPNTYGLDTFVTEEPYESADTLAFDEPEYPVPTPRAYQCTEVMEPLDDQPRAREFRTPGPRRRLRGKQIALIVGGIAVVVAAIVAVAGFALGFWGGIAVPNVVGLDQEEAEAVLMEDGFIPKVLQVKSDEIEGKVLVMDPGAGSFAEEGSEVVIHVATARTIPDIVGEDLETALAMLSEAGYANVKQEIEYTDGQEGLILSVSPEEGTRAKSSMDVTIVVAENYKVPDISGQSADQAKATIEAAGLSPYILYVDTDSYPDGTVIGTDPAAGTKVSEGDGVAITIARVRGIELTNLVEQMLTPGQTQEIGDVSYQIESVDSINYEGDDTVSFSITAKPFVEFFGETLFASSSQTVTGSVVFNSENEVVSIG